jgi:hypothetical protein
MMTLLTYKALWWCVKCGYLPIGKFQKGRTRCDDCLHSERGYQQKQTNKRKYKTIIVGALNKLFASGTGFGLKTKVSTPTARQ